jgi:hypothetical protein
VWCPLWLLYDRMVLCPDYYQDCCACLDFNCRGTPCCPRRTPKIAPIIPAPPVVCERTFKLTRYAAQDYGMPMGEDPRTSKLPF